MVNDHSLVKPCDCFYHEDCLYGWLDQIKNQGANTTYQTTCRFFPHPILFRYQIAKPNRPFKIICRSIALMIVFVVYSLSIFMFVEGNWGDRDLFLVGVTTASIVLTSSVIVAGIWIYRSRISVRIEVLFYDVVKCRDSLV
ncbi:hypothetical protein L596_011993 [Steinernema carpocapsae]|uniref:Uncharacterized protein n=1 Tax=Steinernema carpocapsae TaxID=34508 RepID=A0A4U5NWK2_STECR|nr:hypothetical protein L596_011993 [Steinernema carpocapsae]